MNTAELVAKLIEKDRFIAALQARIDSLSDTKQRLQTAEWAIRQLVAALPTSRDWLDPDLEQTMLLIARQPQDQPHD